MIHVAAYGLHQMIEDKRPILDKMFAKYGLKLGTVFEYETDVATIDDMPCIMPDEVFHEERSWVESGSIMESRYSVQLRGYLGYDDNDQNARAIREFSSAFLLAFERVGSQEWEITHDEYMALWPHIEIPPQNLKLHYHYEVGMQSADIDYALVGGTLCRSFTTTWTGYMTRSANWAFGI